MEDQAAALDGHATTILAGVETGAPFDGGGRQLGRATFDDDAVAGPVDQDPRADQAASGLDAHGAAREGTVRDGDGRARRARVETDGAPRNLDVREPDLAVEQRRASELPITREHDGVDP